MTIDRANRRMRILGDAMRAEFEGHHFYTMAARSCQDPKGQQVFARLAQEELGHYAYLKGQLEALGRTGLPDHDLRLEARTDLVGASPIFSEGIRARIGDAHFEMTALSVGVHLERDAEAYYRGAADGEDDPELKAAYLELAAWEAGHYRALLGQQDELKEDYWAASGFAPF
jgi:rubrerythrin